jgi:hypothetical protein
VIVVAKEGTKLPFDTNDIPTIFFLDHTRLEEALRSRIGRLSGRLVAFSKGNDRQTDAPGRDSAGPDGPSNARYADICIMSSSS